MKLLTHLVLAASILANDAQAKDKQNLRKESRGRQTKAYYPDDGNDPFFHVHPKSQKAAKASMAIPMRKEIRSLTRDELERYFTAIRKWQDGEVPADVSSIPNYATYVAVHAASAQYQDSIGHLDRMHSGGHFLPFHAAMMLEFEKAIRYYDPSVSAHYWDWTVEPEAIFTEEYVGAFDPTGTGTITDGFLKDFPVNKVGQVMGDKSMLLSWRTNGDIPYSMDKESPLRGSMASSNTNSLIGRLVGILGLTPGTKDDVSICLDKKTYKEHWCCIFFDDEEKCKKEESSETNLHGLVHGWSSGGHPISSETGEIVGGYAFDGADVATSPNDPVWFLHHSQVERIHQAWHTSVGAGMATVDDPCGKYDVPDFTQVRLHGLHEPFFPPISDTITNPATTCASLYRGDPLYVYDSYPNGIDAPRKRKQSKAKKIKSTKKGSKKGKN